MKKLLKALETFKTILIIKKFIVKIDLFFKRLLGS